jgi:hypothetical protein
VLQHRCTAPALLAGPLRTATAFWPQNFGATCAWPIHNQLIMDGGTMRERLPLQDVTGARPGACLRGGGGWADGGGDDIDDYDAHGARLDGGVLSEAGAKGRRQLVLLPFTLQLVHRSLVGVFVNERCRKKHTAPLDRCLPIAVVHPTAQRVCVSRVCAAAASALAP